MTVTVTDLLEALARSPKGQVTIPPDSKQLVGVADTKVTVLGNVSVTTTPVAGSGPWFITFKE